MPGPNMVMRRFDGVHEQLTFLGRDVSAMVNRRWWRWWTVWFTEPTASIVTYRLSRALYLLFGSGWSVLRAAWLPLAFVLKPWIGGRCDIHYRAQIGGGFRILHPSLGVVISARAIVGSNLILAGGNCIGMRRGGDAGQLSLGDGVFLGINAVVLGPVRIGNQVTIAAGAVAVEDAADGATLVGVPARALVPHQH
jgi:serine acetyltransferase